MGYFNNLKPFLRNLLLLIFACVTPQLSMAATSDPHQSQSLNAQLITAQNGIAPNTQHLSAGLHLDLQPGWKTYWRTPGEVGLPPLIDWTGSKNIKDVTFLWPAPKRFTAFGIENIGYEGTLVFPLQIELETPGQPTDLQAFVELLVCADVCIPASFQLELYIPNGSGFDQASANLIAGFAASVPGDGQDREISTQGHLSADSKILTLEIRSDTAFQAPDVFPEFGETSAFGKPDIRLSSDGKILWAALPVLTIDDSPDLPMLTVVDDAWAAETSLNIVGFAPTAPYAAPADSPPRAALLWMIVLAFIGGVILNVMPCVLPVLSIKLSSALTIKDKSHTRVRAGFLMSALGIFAFMWVLAIATVAARSFGVSVGWGLQFQNPYFLISLVFITGLFGANMLGMFELNLPSGLQTRMANGPNKGYLGDFATGAFAAILATPCSAPFLGTAVAFALTGSAFDIFVIFTALGFGLALPYFAIAARPRWLGFLPKPGAWMNGLKLIMAALLFGTAIWLISVLIGVTGIWVAIYVGAGFGLLICAISLHKIWDFLRYTSALGAVLIALAAPSFGTLESDVRPSESGIWQPFERSRIAKEIAFGNVVFTDVTADWCLTCLANKRLVLDQAEVLRIFEQDNVIALKADWTRPSDTISQYLESFGKFGIPFNVVYGPNAPDGIALPELLTKDIVLSAIADARGN